LSDGGSGSNSGSGNGGGGSNGGDDSGGDGGSSGITGGGGGGGPSGGGSTPCTVAVCVTVNVTADACDDTCQLWNMVTSQPIFLWVFQGGGPAANNVNQAIRNQIAHDCYNGFINGTKVGKGIGVLSLGPVITPLNDESASQQVLTLAGLWSSFSIKAVIRNLPAKLAAIAEKAEGAFSLGTVVATGADVAAATGCSVSTVFVPLSNNPDPGTPGGNPNDPSDPGNW